MTMVANHVHGFRCQKLTNSQQHTEINLYNPTRVPWLILQPVNQIFWGGVGLPTTGSEIESMTSFGFLSIKPIDFWDLRLYGCSKNQVFWSKVFIMKSSDS